MPSAHLAKRELLRLAQAQSHAPAATKQPAGQITRKPVQPAYEKYSAFVVAQISSLAWPSHPMRGAGRDRHERAVGCSGRESLRKTNASRRGRRSRVVPTPRRWRQVREKYLATTVARKPGHRGEHEISRKPLRRESRIASAGPVCSCAFFRAFVHTRPRVQRASGFPCALFLLRGGHRRKARAQSAPRDRETASARGAVIARNSLCA